MTDFKAFIEIPQGSSVKYEVNEENGQLEANRFLYTAFSYPFNYGWIENTRSQDGDHLDVLVLSSQPVFPGCWIKCQAIGIVDMEDEEGLDPKIIAVPVKKVDPVFGAYENITDVPQPTLDKIKHFFENYKTLEPGKWVKVKSLKGREEAEAEIENSKSASESSK